MRHPELPCAAMPQGLDPDAGSSKPKGSGYRQHMNSHHRVRAASQEAANHMLARACVPIMCEG